MEEKTPVHTGGRPDHVPTAETRQKVIDLSCNGITQVGISEYLEISETTLRKHYKEELARARRDKTTKLGNLLYQRALDGDAGAQEFWLKCQGNWSYARPPEDDKKSVSDTLLEKLIEKL